MANDVSLGGGYSHLLYDYTASAAKATLDTNNDGPFAGPFNPYYKVLEIFLAVRLDTADTTHQVNFTINNDTGANYEWQDLGAANTTLSGSAAAASANVPIFVTGDTETAAFATAVMMRIPFYSETTFNKNGDLIYSRTSDSTSRMAWVSYAFGWKSTAAITRITFTPNVSGNFKAGTHLAIYGR
jgi:hypothetical protein